MTAQPLRRPAPPAAEAGFTLIEVIFAIAFLGFGLMATAQLIPLATRQVVNSKQITDAVASGQTLMEELTMLDYDDPDLEAGDHTDTDGKYTRSWTVTDDTPVAKSKRVDMTVTWTTAAGEQQARLSTFINR